MFISKENYKKIKCVNGCDLFEDKNNYSYWEENEVTIDEKEITEFLNKSNLSLKKNFLHIGIGNSFLALNLKNYNQIDGVSISNNEIVKANNLKISNYKVYLKNKYSSGDLILDKINFYDFIIDNNLKSFACCDNAFEDLIKKYKKYLKKDGSIISSFRGMNWSRIVKPVYGFSLKKIFYKKLKEFDGPSSNLMSLQDCQNLCSKYHFNLIKTFSNLVLFTNKI